MTTFRFTRGGTASSRAGCTGHPGAEPGEVSVLEIQPTSSLTSLWAERPRFCCSLLHQWSTAASTRHPWSIGIHSWHPHKCLPALQTLSEVGSELLSTLSSCCPHLLPYPRCPPEDGWSQPCLGWTTAQGETHTTHFYNQTWLPLGCVVQLKSPSCFSGRLLPSYTTSVRESRQNPGKSKFASLEGSFRQLWGSTRVGCSPIPHVCIML